MRRACLPVLCALVIVLPAVASAQVETFVRIFAEHVSFDPDNGDVIWSRFGECGIDEFSPACRILSRHEGDLTGNALLLQHNDASRPGFDPGNSYTRTVAGRGGQLFWISANGIVYRGERSRLGWRTHISQKVDVHTKSELALAGSSRIYWTENLDAGPGRLYAADRGRTPLSVSLARDNPERPLLDLKGDDLGGALYITSYFAGLCCGRVLDRVVPDGEGGFTRTTARQQGIEAFAVFGDHAYWITRQAVAGGFELRAAPLANLTADFLVRRLHGDADTTYSKLAVDRHGYYWQSSQVADGAGLLWRLARDGSAPTPISVDNLLRLEYLIATGNYVFAKSRDGIILRFGAGTPSALLDVVADEQPPEAVQIIQNPDHELDLVAEKPTVVRAFGRIDSPVAGRTISITAPGAFLHGTRDGRPLPGSPLRPSVRRPLDTAAIDRTTLNNTFLFDLPMSWRRGEVELRAEFNPLRTTGESDLSNNSAPQTIQFVPTRNLCLEFILVQTHAGVSRPGLYTSLGAALAQVSEHVERAQSMLPVGFIAIAFNSGLPRRIPGVGDHCNMNDGDHQNMLLMNLNTEFTFTDPPAACGDARNIRAAMVPESNNTRGQSSLAEAVLWFTEDFDLEGVHGPQGGITLAHEIGHELGRPHVDCGGANFPGVYPYPPCQIAASNEFVGFDTQFRALVVPLAGTTSLYRDLMAWAGGTPRWPSPYTHERIHNDLKRPGGRVGGDSRDAMAAMGAVGAGDEEPEPDEAPAPAAMFAVDVTPIVIVPVPVTHHLIPGLIPADGPAQLGFAYPVRDVERIAARVAERIEPHDDLELRLYDPNNVLISASPVYAAWPHDAELDSPLTFLHILTAPLDAAPMRLELFQAGVGVIAERVAGAAPPRIEVISPLPGDVIGARLTVEWDAFDPDLDPLRHAVRYSADGGQTWTPLAVDLTDGFLEVETARLPGSDDAWIEIMSTDGLNSGTKLIGPIRTPTHAPEAVILNRAGRVQGDADLTVIRQSEVANFSARAYDLEDGELPGDLYTWNLTGPIAQSFSGREPQAGDLPPGDYRVEVLAFDSNQSAATIHTHLRVLPKLVPTGPLPRIDGRCDDPEYGLDDDPATLFHGDGRLSSLRWVRTGTDLTLCISGLPQQDDDWFVAYFDHPGQALALSREGDAVVVSPDPKNPWGEVISQTSRDGDTWSAELRLRLHTDLPSFARLSHVRQGNQPAETVWPLGSQADDPATYGAIAASDAPPATPPAILVPAAVIVAAAGPNGETVDYQAAAQHDEDPEPSLHCDPPSGSHFPVGATLVTCESQADNGLMSLARFFVRVDDEADPPGAAAQARVLAVRDHLQSLLPTGVRKTDRLLNAAIGALDDALSPDLWADADTLDLDRGQVALNKLRVAVVKLNNLQDPQRTAQPIAALRSIARGLAQAGIDQAVQAIESNPNGRPNRLRNAHKALENAVTRLGEGDQTADAAAAIQAYRQAWLQARTAINRANGA